MPGTVVVTAVEAVGPDPVLAFLLQVVVLLTSAMVLGRVAVRLGLPAIVGELCVGVLLGPSVLGHAAPAVSHWLLPQGADKTGLFGGLAQIGVLLLIGLTGVGIDGALFRRKGRAALRVGILALVVPLSLGVLAGWLMPERQLPAGADRPTAALFLGVAMGISALPVTAKILMDMKLFHRNVGQLTLMAAALDDVAGWVLLSFASVMVTAGLGGGNAVALLYPCAFVTVAWLAGRPLTRLAVRLAMRSADAGPVIVVTIAVTLCCAAAAHVLGMDAVFGAFVGGLLVGSAREDVAARLAPLRTVTLAVLAPLFFATAGLHVDLLVLADPGIVVLGLVLLVIAVLGKFAGAYAGARLVGLTSWEGVAVGAGLNARGVVEIVVAGVGLRLGVLNDELYTIIVLIAIITSIMAPPILRAAMSRIEQTAEERLRAMHADPAPLEH
ncbi:cation:proton antiporter [Microbispora amethystogenes]|uniref:cation:proton antiporter n=1 Tax=Microbispora amethystogenes TaxID=1427754 RepID=UPI0033D8A509